MGRKILDGLAVLSFFLTVGILGSGAFGYFSSPLTPQQQKIKQKKSAGLPFMSINHIECYEQEPQVFGDSFSKSF